MKYHCAFYKHSLYNQLICRQVADFPFREAGFFKSSWSLWYEMAVGYKKTNKYLQSSNPTRYNQRKRQLLETEDSSIIQCLSKATIL